MSPEEVRFKNTVVSEQRFVDLECSLWTLAGFAGSRRKVQSAAAEHCYSGFADCLFCWNRYWQIRVNIVSDAPAVRHGGL